METQEIRNRIQKIIEEFNSKLAEFEASIELAKVHNLNLVKTF